MSAIQEIQERLQGTNALIARYQEALDLPTTSASEAQALKVNLRSLLNLAARLESQFLEYAATEKVEVYRYRLLTGQRTPSLAGIGEAWSKLEDLYAEIYKGLTTTKLMGKVVDSMPQSPQLGFAYSFPGSVGVVVTLPRRPIEESLLSDSPTENASDIVFNLIEGRDIQGIAQTLGPGPIRAMNDWLSVHIKHHYGLSLEWKADNRTRRTKEVGYEELQGLQNKVLDTKTRQTVTLTGLLTMVDADNKSFRLKPDGASDIVGKFAEGVIREEHAASVPSRYTATIQTVTEMVATTGKKPKVEVFLERLEPL
jgi:hypothetical protein